MSDFDEELVHTSDLSDNSDLEDDIENDEIIDDTLAKLEELDLDNNKEFDPFFNDYVEFEEMIEINSSKLNFYKIKSKEDRKTKPYINKYEFTKLLGIRTEQITNGAQILLNNEQIIECKKKPLLLAMKEMEEKTFPLILKRRYVDKKGDYTYEEWKVEELYNVKQMILYFRYDI